MLSPVIGVYADIFRTVAAHNAAQFLAAVNTAVFALIKTGRALDFFSKAFAAVNAYVAFVNIKITVFSTGTAHFFCFYQTAFFTETADRTGIYGFKAGLAFSAKMVFIAGILCAHSAVRTLIILAAFFAKTAGIADNKTHCFSTYSAFRAKPVIINTAVQTVASAIGTGTDIFIALTALGTMGAVLGTVKTETAVVADLYTILAALTFRTVISSVLLALAAHRTRRSLSHPAFSFVAFKADAVVTGTAYFRTVFAPVANLAEASSVLLALAAVRTGCAFTISLHKFKLVTVKTDFITAGAHGNTV